MGTHQSNDGKNGVHSFHSRLNYGFRENAEIQRQHGQTTQMAQMCVCVCVHLIP